MHRVRTDEEFAQFLADMTDEEFAAVAFAAGMDSVPSRTPAGYLAVFEAMAAGVCSPDRARLARTVSRTRRLSARPAVVALRALFLRAVARPAVPAGARWRAVRRLLPQAGHGAVAPARGDPCAAVPLPLTASQVRRPPN